MSILKLDDLKKKNIFKRDWFKRWSWHLLIQVFFLYRKWFYIKQPSMKAARKTVRTSQHSKLGLVTMTEVTFGNVWNDLHIKGKLLFKIIFLLRHHVIHCYSYRIKTSRVHPQLDIRTLSLNQFFDVTGFCWRSFATSLWWLMVYESWTNQIAAFALI